MKTFAMWLAMKNEATNNNQQQNPIDPDKDVDDEIANNPQLLQPAMMNKDPNAVRNVIQNAVNNRKRNPKISMDASLKASAMSQKRLS